MNLSNGKYRNTHTGAGLRIRRTDGSNRIYEATCTDINAKSIGFRSQAIFVVGEVIELVFSNPGGEGIVRQRARVVYRTSDRYGLVFLEKACVPEIVSLPAA